MPIPSSMIQPFSLRAASEREYCVLNTSETVSWPNVNLTTRPCPWQKRSRVGKICPLMWIPLMLKINHALGFRPYLVGGLWQVKVKQVADYLILRLGINEIEIALFTQGKLSHLCQSQV